MRSGFVNKFHLLILKLLNFKICTHQYEGTDDFWDSCVYWIHDYKYDIWMAKNHYEHTYVIWDLQELGTILRTAYIYEVSPVKK